MMRLIRFLVFASLRAASRFARSRAGRDRSRMLAAGAVLIAACGFGCAAAARPAGAPPAMPAPPAAGAGNADANSGREAPRNNPNSLSPEQREAIRQLSREQREAIAGKAGARSAGANGQGGARLSPRERHELRDVIREEHERNRKGRSGSGRRP